MFSLIANLTELTAELKAAERFAIERGPSVETIKQLSPLILGYTTVTLHLTFGTMFRARQIGNEPPPNNLSGLWHPPAQMITRIGRANLPGEPMLYCSDGELTAINEVRGTVGDRITILRLGMSDPNKSPVVFALGEISHRFRTKRSLLGFILDQQETMRRESDPNFQRSLLIDGFLARAFRAKGEASYPFTTAVAQIYLSASPADGIIYPTVLSDHGFNIAMKPSNAKRLLTVQNAYVIRLEAKTGISFKAKCEMTSKVIRPDGSIVWSSGI